MSVNGATVPTASLVTGYPKLAEQMEIIPEIAMFRRFGALNAQDLLYRQAELTHLEDRLREAESINSQSADPYERGFSTDWYYLERLEGSQDHCEQWQLVKRIRECLKEYNKALIHQAAVMKLEEPCAYDINYMQRYLASEEMGPFSLTGRDCKTWGVVGFAGNPRIAPKTDLVALRPRNRADPFSHWVSNTGISWFFRCMGDRLRQSSYASGGKMTVADEALHRLTFVLTTIVASLVPWMSIWILFSMNSLKMRMLVVGAMNVALSICLSVFTMATRSEIFAISAAFSAVQVVFVAVDGHGPK